MKRFQTAFRVWAFADSSKDYFYKENRGDFTILNRNLLFHISGIALCLLVAFFLFSPVLPTTPLWYFSYGAYALFNGAILLLSYFWRKRGASPKGLNLLCIFYFFVALLFGILLGVFISPNSTVSLFLLFACAGQMMFVLPPLYSTSTALFGSVLMAVFSYCFKAKDLAMIDMANALCAVVIGGFLCWYIIRLRVREDHSKQQVIALNRKLEILSTVDGLTGLTNRRKFHSTYDETFSVCCETGTTLTFVMADLDSFKTFNDHYGHIAGDDCLKQVGGALRALAQKHGLTAIRYGGEEFALMGTGRTYEESSVIAHELVRSIDALQIPHAYSNVKGNVTISCGVHCGKVTKADDKMEFLALADQALYRAKKQGGNRVC